VKPASLRTLWLLYAAFILYGGTIPFHFAGDAGLFLDRLHRLRLNPLFSAETGHRLSIPDVVQNVLLFVPFGALGVAAAGAAGRWTWRRVGFVSLLGFGLSCTVEGLQLLMRDRVASTADVMTNTAGALLGGVTARWAWLLSGVAIRRLRAEGLMDVQEARLVAVAGGALCVAFLQPFDVTLEVGVVLGHVRAFVQDPWQFTGLRDEGIVMLIASLFAMSLAAYLLALGERGAGRKATALGIGVVCVLEASQVLLGSRMPALWDAAVGSAGIVVGTGLWGLSNRIIWPRLWQGLLIAMTIIAVAMQMLSPFEWAPAYRGFSWFPGLGYYTRTTFETLSHVIELLLAYFPLGFCLALGADSKRRAVVLALLLTFLICVPIEYLQGWVVGRYPDISDIGLSLLGAWIGSRLARTVS
jgi:glycopeptide antibiotics resistance protein